MRLAILLLPLAVAQAEAAPLAAHHAVYRLSLNTDHVQEVTEAHGTMTYDVVDTCAAWTTSQHLVIDFSDKDGQSTHMVSDYATLESHDGTRLEFHTKQVTGQAVTAQFDGVAVLERPGGRGHADYSSPEKKSVLLPIGTLLPMAHTGALLDAAMAGKKFLSVPLFDGTGAGGAQDTFVTVEGWHQQAAAQASAAQASAAHASTAQPPPAAKTWAALSALPFGRVHIAFFDRGSAAETPDYEIGMQYFVNGVADALSMQFGDFAMDGKLEALDVHPPHC